MSDSMQIDISYKPRWYQKELENAIFDDKKKRALIVWHRRAGKDIECLQLMLKAMLGKVGLYYYFFPTFRQARAVIWDGIDESGSRIIDAIPRSVIDGKPNETQMKIRLLNGSLFQLVGTDNFDAIAGTNPCGCVFSEYSLQDPTCWEMIISPILVKNGGWAVFNGTPRGKNHQYKLDLIARDNPDKWYYNKLTIEDTKLIALEDIDQERKEGKSEELIQQEYYCSYDRGVEGSYYGKILDATRKDGRIGRIAYEPRSMVNTYWDIGYGDSTSIVFSQQVGTEFRIIDFYESQGEAFAHYAKVLQGKPYVYGQHYFPHDAGSHSLQTGKNLQQIAREQGISAIILDRDDIEIGIEAARSLLAVCYIDETKCSHLLKCLENYHKKYNDKMGCYSTTPVHDWSSHACFVGETEVLTRNGMCQIMELPSKGEVMTLWGWKAYQNPNVTRRNASLVEVTFADGMKVKCTEDHLFLTESGWKSAGKLQTNTKIQSCWTQSLNTLTEDYIVCGKEKDTHHEAGKGYTKQFGSMCLGSCQKGVTYIIKTEIQAIIASIIWNACQLQSIFLKLGMKIQERIHLPRLVETQQLNGMHLKRAGFGIKGTQKILKAGPNGLEKKENASFAFKNFNALLETTDMSRNIAAPIVKQPIIESVKKLQETADVWCLTVPEAGHFSLANGAIVHNCDAFRYCAMARQTYGGRGVNTLSPDKIKDMRQKYLGY